MARQRYKFRATNHTCCLVYGFCWLICWTVSMWFTFQNKSAWQPNWRRMLGRGSDPSYPSLGFFFVCLSVCLFLDSLIQQLVSSVYAPAVFFVFFFQLATPFYHRTSQKWIPTIFFFQFFTSCDWTSHRAHSASDLCSLIFMFILCPCLCAIGRASTQATCFYVFNFLTTVCSEPLSRNYSFF